MFLNLVREKNGVLALLSQLNYVAVSINLNKVWNNVREKQIKLPKLHAICQISRIAAESNVMFAKKK